MDLHKAYQTLGLSRAASREEIDEAYQRLCGDLEARIDRVSAAPVQARYRELRASLDVARQAILAAPPAPSERSLDEAFGVLGLPANASPLDVAAAYVSLCDSIEREAKEAPTEELRRACLEARADVDAAYQRCTVSPLREGEDAALPSAEDGTPAAVAYETQMAAEPFEAAADETEDPGPALTIEPEPDPAEAGRQRRSRRRGRALGWAAAWLLLLGAGTTLAARLGWIDGGTLQQLASAEIVEQVLPKALAERLRARPDPALLEAQSTAEYLRTRVAEERQALLDRVRESADRALALEQSWAGISDPDDREQMAENLSRARARRSLSSSLSKLAEQHVFDSPELAAAIGKIQRGNELMGSGDERDAKLAFEEARIGLEDALQLLDAAEEAAGARSEAEAGLEAWRTIAASAALEESQSATEAQAILAAASSLLDDGDFDAAVPELRRAAQQFGIAVSEGRKLAAELRVDEAPETPTPIIVAAQGPPPESPELSAVVADIAPPAPPPVAAPPPDRQRSAIKLVLVPAGDFFYGCKKNGEVCDAAEIPGRTVSLRAFRIDRTEVRVSEYRKCVAAGACSSPGAGEGCNWAMPDRGEHPVNCVDWRQAREYCTWVGKRLPTELEWEKAARGSDGRRYPWGNAEASCDQAVISTSGAAGCGADSTWPVASRSMGRSPFGLFDMAGNVLEWTSDTAGPRDDDRVARGGSWRSAARPVRTSSRDWLPAAMQDASVGFRCAQDASPVTASTGR
jgi:formylglycine-generating enzyme required for sulfatase activity